MAEHLRGRCFATTRFRCTNIRYTGDVCGCTGSVEIEPTVLLPVGGKNYLAFLFCRSCQPSWEINHVLIDQPPWSVAKRVRGDRFKCPGCHRAVALAHRRADLAADRFPRRGGKPHRPARGGAGDAGAVNVSGLSRRLFRKGRTDQQVPRWCRHRDLPRRSPISRYAPNQTDCQPSRLSEATRCLPPKFTASG
jgi:hypothetical protein